MALVTSAAASLKTTWGFSPQSIPGLALWLDGADTTSITGTSSSVTAWRDKSGSGYSAVPHSGTIEQTTLNGQNALNFKTSVMKVPSFTWTSSFTQIFVGYVTGGQGIIIDTMTDNGSQYGDYVYTGNGNLMNVNNPANSGILQVYDTAAGASTPVPTTNQWFIFCIGYGSTGTAAINYTLNGTVRSTTVSPATPPYTGGSATNPPLTLYINGYMNGTLTLGGAQIAELIHFNTDITATQRQQVEGYLAAKWGLKVNLPPTHPYSATNIIPFNRPFYPTDIPGCQLWLDGADRSSMTFSSGSVSNVSVWNDKSGAGNNATGSTSPYPQYNIKTLNGLPVIGLEASTDQFFVNNNFTVTTFPTITYACVFSGNGSTGTDPIGGIITTDTAGCYGRSLGLSNQIIQIENYNSFTATSSTLSLGQFYTVVVTFNGATEMTVSVNGSKSTYAGSTGSFNNTAGLYIGNYLGNGAQYGTNMDIAELLIYGTALSTSQRQQVEQYLAWKWGLVANLPPSHPGKLMPAFSTGFTVKSISGCQLWLDAADRSTFTLSGALSNITQWNDKSGNGNNGTATGSPALTQTGINGRQAVTAAVGTCFLGPISMTGQSLTCFGVATTDVTLPNVRSPRADQRLVSLANGTNPDYQSNGMIPLFNQDSTSTIAAWNYNYSPNGILASNPIVTGTPFMAVSRLDGTTASLWFNGSPGTLASSSFSSSVTATKYGIGNQANPTIEYWSGFIGEIILFNTALTTQQRQQVEGYLAWKWGLQSSLPSTHAYAKFSP